jgi:hypothetical protein
MQAAYWTSATGFEESEEYAGVAWNDPGNYGSGSGRLIKKKYLGNSRKILTCPALSQAISLNESNKLHSYRAGYYFNPHPAYDVDVSKARGDNSSTGLLTTRYKQLKQIPKNRCLAIDFFYDRSALGHFDAKTNTWYINCVYADGHALSVANTYAYNRMMGAGGTLGWGWQRGCDVIGSTELLGAGESISGRQDGLFNDKGGVGMGNEKAFYSIWPQVRH